MVARKTSSQNSIQSPFGMVMPGRNWTAAAVEGYRFGFNSQEQDNEIYDDGNLNTAKFWEYDTRIGRRWNIDPKSRSENSAYSCFGDNPIFNTDIDGDYYVGLFGQKVNVKQREDGSLKVGMFATKDLKRIIKLTNESGSVTAINEALYNSKTRTRIHVVIDSENTGQDGLSLMGYHQPHDQKGRPLAYMPNPGGKNGKWDGEVAFIKDENGNDIFKEATITIFEKSITPDKIQSKLRQQNIDFPDMTKEEYMVATFAHELFHDRDEENIKHAKDNQEGRPNNTDVERRAYGITNDVTNEIKKNRKNEK